MFPGTTRTGIALVGATLGVVLLAHAVELSGWLSSNPIFFNSGLGAGTVAGPLPGFPGWIDFHAGATIQALGRLNAEQWLAWTVPWWNRYAGLGLPLAGEMQSGSLFLPFVLLLRCFDGVMLLKIAMQGVAGLAMLALLRRLGLGATAAWAGASLYALGGNFAWLSDAPIMPPPFLPVLALGIERARLAARLGRPAGYGLIAVAIAYLLLAGFPETAYFCGLLGLAWAVPRLAGIEPDRRLAFAAKVANGGVAGLLIAAPCLLAFLQYLGRAWPLPRPFAHAALHPANFAQDLFPYLLGPLHYQGRGDLWFHTGGYLGAGAVFLALVGLAGSGRERGLRILLLAWIAAGIGKSADLPIVTELVNLQPAVTQTLFFRYITPTVIFAIAVLAALTLDDMRRGDWPRPRARALTALAIFAALAAACLSLAAPELRSFAAAGGQLVYPAVSIAVGCLLVLALALLCARARPQARAAAAIAVAESLALFTVPLLSGTPHGVLNLGPVAFLRDHLGESRFLSVGPITPNYGAYFRLASINHNYLPIDEAWGRYASAHVNASPYPDIFNGTTPAPADQFRLLRNDMAVFTALGVRYVAAFRWADPFADGVPPGVSRPYDDGSILIYELPDPAPYAEAAGCTLAVRDADTIDGACARPSRLVRRALFYPGWTARLDGRDAPVLREGEVFQAVDLPAGRFALRFGYAPPWAGWAWAGCGLGLLLLAVAFWREAGALSRSRESPASR